MATQITRTNIAIDNLPADVLAQIEAVLKANNLVAETTTNIRYESESVCGFLGLAVDTDKVKEDSATLFSKEAMEQAKALKARRNAQNSQLANLL